MNIEREQKTVINNDHLTIVLINGLPSIIKARYTAPEDTKEQYINFENLAALGQFLEQGREALAQAKREQSAYAPAKPTIRRTND